MEEGSSGYAVKGFYPKKKSVRILAVSCEFFIFVRGAIGFAFINGNAKLIFFSHLKAVLYFIK